VPRDSDSIDAEGDGVSTAESSGETAKKDDDGDEGEAGDMGADRNGDGDGDGDGDGVVREVNGDDHCE